MLHLEYNELTSLPNLDICQQTPGAQRGAILSKLLTLSINNNKLTEFPISLVVMNSGKAR
jgi:Leucine-rich repeat (LRR) protein